VGSEKKWAVLGQPGGSEIPRGKAFLQYYLEKMAAYQRLSGQRLLDVVDVHAHLSPFGDEADAATQVHRRRTAWLHLLLVLAACNGCWQQSPVVLLPVPCC